MSRLYVPATKRSASLHGDDVHLVAVSDGQTTCKADERSVYHGRLYGGMNTSQPIKRLYTVKEAGQYLGRTTWGVRHLIWKGKLPQVRCGKCIHVDIRDLERFVEQNKYREPTD